MVAAGAAATSEPALSQAPLDQLAAVGKNPVLRRPCLRQSVTTTTTTLGGGRWLPGGGRWLPGGAVGSLGGPLAPPCEAPAPGGAITHVYHQLLWVPPPKKKIK